MNLKHRRPSLSDPKVKYLQMSETPISAPCVRKNECSPSLLLRYLLCQNSRPVRFYGISRVAINREGTGVSEVPKHNTQKKKTQRVDFYVCLCCPKDNVFDRLSTLNDIFTAVLERGGKRGDRVL